MRCLDFRFLFIYIVNSEKNDFMNRIINIMVINFSKNHGLDNSKYEKRLTIIM